MISIEDLNAANDRIEAAERQRRLAAREERTRLRRRVQRQNYIVGGMVCEHFPELRQIEPGTKAENAVRFLMLNHVLKLMADSPELIGMLKNTVCEIYGEQCDLFCASTYTSDGSEEEVRDGTQSGSLGEG
ncbi:MAG: hypothetical protein IKN81_06405 [Oscillospiraceae bacterium]|nr:hypothetical protein [Oscillospiraceae bacterium]